MFRSGTLRQRIVEELQDSPEPISLKEISKLVGVSEKDLTSHLEHIAKSLKNSNKKLVKFPASCKQCGFELNRRDFKKPSRCPNCRSENISPVFLQIRS